jgi:hypothetical protein
MTAQAVGETEGGSSRRCFVWALRVNWSPSRAQDGGCADIGMFKHRFSECVRNDP